MPSMHLLSCCIAMLYFNIARITKQSRVAKSLASFNFSRKQLEPDVSVLLQTSKTAAACIVSPSRCFVNKTVTASREEVRLWLILKSGASPCHADLPVLHKDLHVQMWKERRSCRTSVTQAQLRYLIGLAAWENSQRQYIDRSDQNSCYCGGPQR